VLSTGMGLVMAPATESIMGSLPPAKAGVGSAMNDTTRQMGGALGVAIIGSIAAASYRPGVTHALVNLQAPADVVNAAKDSVGGAIAAINKSSLTDPVKHLAITASRSEFVHSFGWALRVGSVVLLGAAAIVFMFLPARARDVGEEQETALDGVASLTFAEAEGVLEEEAAVR
jgi:hypothetical protein